MTAKQAKFQKTVYDFYAKNKRTFPWRKTKDPYHILVSEIMLQQTQTSRVVPKFTSFIETFPTIHDLARSDLATVLQKWQGLGYNRRGMMLHKAARVLESEYGGKMPNTQKELESLPGIGPYTASAIIAFAYNKPVIMIETNIRSVYIHHFFHDMGGIDDKEILPLIEQTLDHTSPRKWYSALMDYGAHLKTTLPNPNRKSRHYTKQSRFEGSDRQIRGKIIRLLNKHPMQEKKLITLLETTFASERARTTRIIDKLIQENMIQKKSGIISIS